MSEETSMFELLKERLTEEEIIKITCDYDLKFCELEEENKQLKDQLQQKDKELEARKQLIIKQDKELWTLEHIIKEVREHLQETINRWEDYEQFYEVVVEDKYILGILDKEVN